MKQQEQRHQQPHTQNPEPAPAWRVLAEFSLSSALGLEAALAQVAAVGREVNLPAACRERLAQAVTKAFQSFKTDVSQEQPDQRLDIRILSMAAIAAADLLPQEQGWGFFLVEKSAKNNQVRQAYQEIDLFLYLEGGDNDDQAVV